MVVVFSSSSFICIAYQTGKTTGQRAPFLSTSQKLSFFFPPSAAAGGRQNANVWACNCGVRARPLRCVRVFRVNACECACVGCVALRVCVRAESRDRPQASVRACGACVFLFSKCAARCPESPVFTSRVVVVSWTSLPPMDTRSSAFVPAAALDPSAAVSASATITTATTTTTTTAAAVTPPVSAGSNKGCGVPECRKTNHNWCCGTEQCPLCHKFRKSFHCKTCVGNGDFGHSSASVDKGRSDVYYYNIFIYCNILGGLCQITYMCQYLSIYVCSL